MKDPITTIIKFGILVGQDNKDLNEKSFKDMNELRVFLNNKYDINIKNGMEWKEVLNILKPAIEKKKFDNAMTII